MRHHHRTWRSTAVALAVVSIGLMPQATAGSADRQTTYVTFSQPVQVPGATLAAGTYLFDIPEPITAYKVVRIRSRDGRTPYFMGFTHAVEPPRGRHLGPVSLAEAEAGAPPRISVWWLSGEEGRQFQYAETR